MTYAVSDIHGCYDQYQAMLQKIVFSSQDTLYVLGDVIDRGPDGVSILQHMMKSSNIVPILGNHEVSAAICMPFLLEKVTDVSVDTLDAAQIAALNEWILNGGAPTLRALHKLTKEERENILRYILGMNVYEEIEVGGRSFVLTHAGLNDFVPDKPMDAYRLEDFIFGRPDPDAVYWLDRILIFGHTPTRILAGEEKIFSTGGMIDIDCGCVFEGGRLGCLCLDTMEEFYVQR